MGRTNTRTERQGAQHGGEECPGPASIEESCNVQECPVDCVWGDWEYDVCSAECGGGTQPMVRIKIQEAMIGGLENVPSHALEEPESTQAPSLPKQCMVISA